MANITVVHISDTHNDYSFKTGRGDILIHSGDATRTGTLDEVKKLKEYFLSVHQDFKHIIFTPGNHDFLFANDLDKAKKELAEIPNLKILINETVELMGLKIFASPYSTTYGNWCFMDTNDNLHKIWNKIEDDTNIIVTHGPAYGELDYFASSGHIGANSLKWKIEQVNPALHLFGHVHESWGVKHSGQTWHVNSALGETLYLISEQFAHKIIIDNVTKQVVEISDVD